MICTDYSKSEEIGKDIFKTVDNIAIQIKETQDEFIFSTLNKFASTNYDITVDKKELIMAIQFIRMCRETGTDLRRCHCSATDMRDFYKKGYDAGFEAGIQEARNKIERAFN